MNSGTRAWLRVAAWVAVAWLAVSGRGRAVAGSAPDYAFPLEAGSWAPTPSWTGKDAAAEHAHAFADGVATFTASGGGRTMIWARYYPEGLDIKGLRYLTIRYRAEGVDPALRSYFLYLSPRRNSRMTSDCLALGAKDLTIDGRWHRLTTQLKIHDSVFVAALRFKALAGKQGVVQVSELRFSRERPKDRLADRLHWTGGRDATAGEPLDFARATPLPALQKAAALGDWFSAQDVTVAGAPFRVAIAGKVAASTPRKDKTTLKIAVGRPCASIWLLMVADFSPRILTYDAWQPGDSMDQPERFSVKTVYADGASERQLPYCVDKKQHAIWRGLHVYEVALDDKPVREIVVRDGMRTSAFHLVAATAGATRFAPEEPEVWSWPSAEAASRTSGRPSVLARAEETALANNVGALTLSHKRGLRVTHLRAAAGIPWRITCVRTPLFSIREGKQRWSAADFAWERAVDAGRVRATFAGRCAAAEMEARIEAQARERGEFAFTFGLRNMAKATRFASVTFPQMKVRHTTNADVLWYFIPQSCGVLANRDRMFRKGYGGKMPVQWMDFFDREKGGGVFVATRTQSVQHRWYEAGKEAGVGVARVEYMDNIPLPPGEWVDYPPAVIGLHAGDWHAAHAAYMRWRAIWHKPLKARLDWFRRRWHLRTHWIRTLGSRGKTGLAKYNWLDPATGKLRPLHFVKKDRDAFGYIDYIHIFDWRVSPKYGRWGDYSHYEPMGGLDAFHTAIKAVQDEGIPVGLYLDTFLCSRKSLIFQKHGKEWALKNRAGRFGEGYSTADDPVVNMCTAYPGWQDYLAKTCARVARETGCNGIYLDEGGMDLPQYYCWRKDHGHAVPATTIAAQRLIFEKVKRALPDHVALYTEYTPCDALVPYLDGAYMACLRHSTLDLSPGYVNMSRFSFPDFKCFVIPNGGSMFDGIYDGLNYSLFNGVALYSLSWGHDAEAFSLCAKISRILKRYEDAFLTLTPRPLVPTTRARVYANEFPGDSVTVWTLWNARYRTVRGPVMWVKHVQGARYRDAWLGRDLTPRIRDGRACIELELEPRGGGVVAQTRGAGPR